MRSIREIAELAGVSTATVSRVLNSNGIGVRASTKERVLAAAAQLQRSSLTHPRIMATVVPDLANPYFVHISRGIEDEAYKHGYGVILGNMDRSLEKTERFLDYIREYNVEGVILAGGGVIDHAFRQLWAGFAARARTVLIGRHNIDLPTVRIDEVTGANDAVKHLIKLGHSRIAMVCGPSTSVAALDRLEGYMSALFTHNIPYSSELIFEGDYSARSGYLAGKRLMALNPRPTAVFCSNDLMALGLLRAAKEAGVAIPEQLSVVGFDRLVSLDYNLLTLTSVQVPSYEMGQQAVKLMLCMLRGEALKEKHIVLPTELHVGESTGVICS